MKFTIFALALCLVCVNALVVPQPPSEDSSQDLALNDLDFLLDGELDVEDLNALTFTYRGLKTILRTIKGFNCAIKWVVGIKASALGFNRDVITCGVTATKDVTNLINANLKIISTCNDVVNMESNICEGVNGEEPTITKRCVVRTALKVWSLKKQVKNVVSLAKKIPQTGPNAVVCVNDAVSTLTTYYTAFPQNMLTCSQLTS
ncbi:uncharacterized protein [Drosophila takahashii]|uniref:uncharacterized protein n=1 Tax=Drosophila takahashii TaxID=29030 RepID=UPI001CF84AE6|nr:uncharacterized protein LOC108064001 [Drosophila takahashii]